MYPAEPGSIYLLPENFYFEVGCWGSLEVITKVKVSSIHEIYIPIGCQECIPIPDISLS